jgi:hypothetical protein
MITRFVVCLLLLSINAYSQNIFVKGKVIDSKDQSPLIGAEVVMLKTGDSTLYKGCTVDLKGDFLLKNIADGKYILKISFIGYKTFVKNIEINKTPLVLDNIALTSKSTQLKAVTVEEKLAPVTLKQDTTQFNAGAYKTNQDATAEELVTKMPGITSQNGTVQAQGENVQQVLVDGKPYFGDDPNAVLKNIPAEIIDKIQVFDKKSDQAQFTGIDDGNTTKTINVITKVKFRNGDFGKIYAGGSDDDKYKAGGSINIFNNDRRISILAQSNNINEQNFTTEDLLGVMSSSNGSRTGGGGGGGGGGRPRGGQHGAGASGGYQGGGNDASNFLVNQQNGIATTNSFGLNYSDKWGKKIDVTASYFYNWSNNNANTNLFRQYVLPSDSGLNYTENNSTTSRNINHRINLKIDYKIDSLNSILFQPKLSLQQNNGNSNIVGENIQNDTLISNTVNQFKSNLKGYNFSSPILYRHKFNKRRRTFSWSITPGINQNNGPSYLTSLSNFYSDTVITQSVNQLSNLNKQTTSLSSNLIYTEPVDSNGMLQINYSDNYNLNNSDKETYNYSPFSNEYDYKDTLLTNTFKSTYFTQNAGATYRFQSKKMQLSVGTSFQIAQLKSNQQFPYNSKIDETFQSILPSAMLRVVFSQNTNLRIFYRTSNNAPSIDQLQNVLNNSNPLQLTIGNPDLKQNYQHSLMLRYSATNTDKSSTFFVLFSGSYTQNYIGNSTIIASHDTVADNIALINGTQLVRPVNLNGYFNLRSFIIYGVPLNKLKCNLNFNISANYTRTPGLINNKTNYANAPTAGLGVILSSNISKDIDFSIGSNSTINYIQNTLQKQLNSNYFDQSTQVKVNWVIWKGLLLNTDVSYQYYNGLSQNFNQKYFLWNGAIAYKFLKDQNAEIRFSVFDMLNQNKSVQRNITDTYIEDTQTNVLQRYFMLIFTYNLKTYKKTGSDVNNK